MYEFITSIFYGTSQIEETDNSEWQIIESSEDIRRNSINNELCELRNRNKYRNINLVTKYLSEMYRDVDEDVKNKIENYILETSVRENTLFYFVKKSESTFRQKLNNINTFSITDTKWKNIILCITSCLNRVFAEKGSNLNFKVLRDMTWSYYILIFREVSDILERALSEDESIILITLFVDELPELIREWNNRIQILGDVKSRMSLLPSKWNRDGYLITYIETKEMKPVKVMLSLDEM